MGAILGPLVDAIIGLFGFIVSFARVLISAMGNLPALLSKFWVYAVSLLPVIFTCAYDKFGDFFINLIANGIESMTNKVDSIPDIPFPSIPTLADSYNALDPLIRGYLNMFRLPEAFSIISVVVVWRLGLSITSKIFGRM